MPEFGSPGIIITERPSTAQVIQGVTTSNMAIVGPTYRGLVNEAQLVTSFPQFESEYGPLTSDGIVPIEEASFFANDGLRSYVNRIVASDAVAASGTIVGGVEASVVQENIGTGTAGTTDSFSATLTVPSGSRIVPGTISVRVGGTGTPGSGSEAATDDKFGVISGANVTGTINYMTGAVVVTETGTDVWGVGISADVDFQTYEVWDLDAISEGRWGNGARTRIEGDLDTRIVQNNPPKAEYTKYKVKSYLKEPEDSATAAFDLAETFEDIDFDDENSVDFVSDVVNDGTKYINYEEVVTAKGGPAILDGISVTGETPNTPVPAGWTGDGLVKQFTGTAKHPAVEPRTARITATDTGDVAMVVTDDGSGNLIGDIDATGNNTINYITGAIDVTFATAVKSTTDALLAYAQAPAVTYIETTLTSGTDGAAAIGRSQVSAPTLESPEEGMFAFNKVDEILQLIIPDFAGNEVILGDQIDYAESRKDVFVIGCMEEGKSPTQSVDFVRNVLGRNTSYCAMYSPWITIADPLRDNRKLNLPPLAHVAGIYARTDTNRNVGKAPAGTIDGAIKYAIGLERKLSSGEQTVLFQGRINPLISTPATGRAVWGSRTLSLESDFRQVGARRLFMFVEKSVFNSTQWVIFESIGPGLFSRIRLTLVGFLQGLYNRSYFAGASPEEAYLVVVDESNNPPAQQEAGLVIIDIAIAPQNPAEFVWFRMQRKTLQAS